MERGEIRESRPLSKILKKQIQRGSWLSRSWGYYLEKVIGAMIRDDRGKVEMEATQEKQSGT